MSERDDLVERLRAMRNPYGTDSTILAAADRLVAMREALEEIAALPDVEADMAATIARAALTSTPSSK